MYSTIDHSWFQANTSQRSFGALSALLITILFLLQFQVELKKFTKTPFLPNNEMQLIWVPTVNSKLENKPIILKPLISHQINHQVSQPTQKKVVRKTSMKMTTLVEPDTNIIEITKENSITTSIKPGLIVDEAPKLIFDSKSIRKAYEDSKTDIQKMAEVSGKPLIKTAHSSENDRFQSAANKAAKKDCFSANSGGSLLSIFIIPVMAALDKCK